MAGDKLKFRTTITDTSIFHNRAQYPDTGWVVMNILPPILSVENEDQPIYYELHQNYPNPFNPSTKIKFTIPQSPLLGGDGRGGLVTLKVYDVLGNEITTLVNEELPAGEYEIEFSPESSIKHPASGIYFYQLRAGSFIQTRKMVYLK